MSVLKTIFGATIEIGMTRYNSLIRQEERLEVLLRYVEANSYLDRKDIAAIIGADLKEEVKEGEE